MPEKPEPLDSAAKEETAAPRKAMAGKKSVRRSGRIPAAAPPVVNMPMTTLRLQPLVRILRRGLNRNIASFLLALMAVRVVAELGSPTGPAWAADLPRPEERVILKISGKIGSTNADKAAEFDRPMLGALPSKTIETVTPWTDGINRFEGPLMRDLLDLVGAEGSRVGVLAINDYTVEIPISDFESHPVILAMKMNGKVLRTRDRGPLWIIYPWRDRPELRSPIFYERSVWQVKEIVVKD